MCPTGYSAAKQMYAALNVEAARDPQQTRGNCTVADPTGTRLLAREAPRRRELRGVQSEVLATAKRSATF